jgi:hypothetical protein
VSSSTKRKQRKDRCIFPSIREIHRRQVRIGLQPPPIKSTKTIYISSLIDYRHHLSTRAAGRCVLWLPLLRLAADQQEHRFRDAVEALAQEFSLSAEQRAELLPSGSQSLFSNRVGWARPYLKQTELLESLDVASLRLHSRDLICSKRTLLR